MFGWFNQWLRKRQLKKLRLIRRKQLAERAFALECKRLHDAAHKAKRAADRARSRAKAKRIVETDNGPVGVINHANPNDSVDRDLVMAALDMLGRVETQPIAPTETFSGKGGAFGGAGASGSWDDSPPDGGATAAWGAAAPGVLDYLQDVAAAHLQSHVDRHDHTSHSSHDYSADVSSYDSHSHTDSGTGDWSSADSSSYSDDGSGSSGGGD